MDRFEIADKLHSAAIHLLRRVRAEDAALELSAPQLSALSVVVFAGPVALSDLAYTLPAPKVLSAANH